MGGKKEMASQQLEEEEEEASPGNLEGTIKFRGQEATWEGEVEQRL